MSSQDSVEANRFLTNAFSERAASFQKLTTVCQVTDTEFGNKNLPKKTGFLEI